jgi:LDH2 family malate/lactate/ureidoglycolate dehydrogenase
VRIEAINLGRRLALTDTGEQLPITDMFDEDGDETDDPDKAVAVIIKAGEDHWIVEQTKWYDKGGRMN